MLQPTMNIAVRAARSAGNIMRRYLPQLEGIPVTQKDRHDYVSEVDHACEQEIIREIRRVFPRDTIVAEESGKTGSGSSVWLIDPLDGTSNFLHGFPQFAVSIAQQVNGRTEHAVVYDPLREELFTASRGGGAYLNNSRLRVSQERSLSNTLLATGFPFRKREHLDTYFAIFRDLFDQVEDMRRPGAAALDLAYVAAGRVDGFWEIGLKPWDMAAGALLVQEAGGVVTNFAGGENFLESGNIIAAPFKLMTPILKTIEPHLNDRLKR